MVVSGGVAVTVLVFISTETVLEPRLATARSGLPSPLRSPTATDAGLVPAAKANGARKVAAPLPNSTETLLEPKLATARSGLPSPLKSPTATEKGLVATPQTASGDRRVVEP